MGATCRGRHAPLTRWRRASPALPRLRDWRLQWADTCDQYCRGAMLSMALGHALGAAIEFMPPPKDNEARQRARMERLLPSWFRRSAPSSSQQRDGDQRNFSGHDDVLTSDDDLDEDDDVPALGHEEPGGNSGGEWQAKRVDDAWASRAAEVARHLRSVCVVDAPAASRPTTSQWPVPQASHPAFDVQACVAM